MATPKSDLEILVLSTWALYHQALREAYNGFKRNWWAAFVPVVYIVFFFLFASTLGKLFSGMAGGLLVGILQALFIANYLAFVACAVDGRKMSLKDIKSETFTLVMPVIGVLFAFFIVDLLLRLILQGGGLQALAIGLNLILVVIFNTLPEVTYLNRGFTMSILQEAAEFIKENTLEWFLPLIILVFPIILANPKGLFLMFASSNALLMPKFYFEIVGSSVLISDGISFALITLFAFVFTFYFMIFRGVLYKKLSTSSRRKRIYQFKFGA